MTANYHTHTKWCRHGTGEIEDYIKKAIGYGFEELAITEHVPFPHDPDDSRMLWTDFDAFDAELDWMVAKYAGQLTVIKGLECEYYPEELDHYRRLRDERGYTLFILGQHNAADHSLNYFSVTQPWQVAKYADDVCAALETGLFRVVAHPDVVANGYGRPDGALFEAMHRIFAACERLGVAVEINANGHRVGRAYPCHDLWRTVAPMHGKLDILVNADAHEARYLCDAAVRHCETMAERAGLKVLARLPGAAG